MHWLAPSLVTILTCIVFTAHLESPGNNNVRAMYAWIITLLSWLIYFIIY